MTYMMNIFPGWSALEIVSMGENIFDCTLMFAAVFLVGLRDA
jgi:hypothetical protein